MTKDAAITRSGLILVLSWKDYGMTGGLGLCVGSFDSGFLLADYYKPLLGAY